jgi:hypothetical protein
MVARGGSAVNAHSWNITYWHDLKDERNTAHTFALGHVAGTGRFTDSGEEQ